jgi:hypothetical protein
MDTKNGDYMGNGIDIMGQPISLVRIGGFTIDGYEINGGN